MLDAFDAFEVRLLKLVTKSWGVQARGWVSEFVLFTKSPNWKLSVHEI